MRCDELKDRVTAGGEMTPALREHLEGCAACGVEFGFLRALCADRPQPPAALRARVLAASGAAGIGGRLGRVGAAAAVLVAATAGFAGGWSAKPASAVPAAAPAVVVREVEVIREIERPVSPDLAACIAIAGQAIYRDKVKAKFNDRIQATEVRVDPAVLGVTVCPVARSIKGLCESQPEVFQVMEKE